jgi:hypothetical protein
MIVAALSVSWPVLNSSATFENVSPHALGAALEISKHLGFTGMLSSRNKKD